MNPLAQQVLAALGLLACLGYGAFRLWTAWRARRPRVSPLPQPPSKPPVEWEGNVARPDFRKRRDKRTLH